MLRRICSLWAAENSPQFTLGNLHRISGNCGQRPRRFKITVVPESVLSNVVLVFPLRLPGMHLSRDPCTLGYIVLTLNERNPKSEPMDSRSRPESQRVTSCANRLVVTAVAYRDDEEGQLGYRTDDNNAMCSGDS